jgi:hypothetical protein
MWRTIPALLATLIGVAFFFVILGLFGRWVSIAALAVFVALSIVIFRRPQVEETR